MTFANTNVLIVLLQGLNSFLTNVITLETKNHYINIMKSANNDELKNQSDNEFLILKSLEFQL